MMGNVVEQVKWKEVITDIMKPGFHIDVLCSVITMAGFTIKGATPKVVLVLNHIKNYRLGKEKGEEMKMS